MSWHKGNIHFQEKYYEQNAKKCRNKLIFNLLARSFLAYVFICPCICAFSCVGHSSQYLFKITTFVIYSSVLFYKAFGNPKNVSKADCDKEQVNLRGFCRPSQSEITEEKRPQRQRMEFWVGFQRHFLELVTNFIEANGNFTIIWYSNKSRGGSDLGCGVAQTVARRLAVRQARVRISARRPRGGPLPKQWGDQECCSTSNIYKMYVCSCNLK